MIVGRFGENGELFFDLELIAADGEQLPVEVLLDTGFTTGYLAINKQDVEALQWAKTATQLAMQTARGEENFDVYAGKVILDKTEFTIAVHVSDGIPEILMGSQWLEILELIVNKPRDILTLQFPPDFY